MVRMSKLQCSMASLEKVETEVKKAPKNDIKSQIETLHM